MSNGSRPGRIVEGGFVSTLTEMRVGDEGNARVVSSRLRS
jgi:hypothetical protein